MTNLMNYAGDLNLLCRNAVELPNIHFVSQQLVDTRAYLEQTVLQFLSLVEAAVPSCTQSSVLTELRLP